MFQHLRLLGSLALSIGAAGWTSHQSPPQPATTARHHLETDSGSWSQYRGNARRTAFAAWPGAREPQILWRLELGPMIDASPVVGPDGTIYVAGPKTSRWPMDQLVAVNQDGTAKWKTILEGYQLRATPAVRNDGSIVAVGHNIYADRVERDGKGTVTKVIWKREAKVFLVGADGSVLRTTDQNRFFEGPGLTSPAYDGVSNDTFYWHIYPLAGANLRRFDSSFAMHGVGGLDVSLEGYSPLTSWEVGLCGLLTVEAGPYFSPLVAPCWACAVEAEGGSCFSPDLVSGILNPSQPPLDALSPSPSLTQCNDVVAGADDTARFRPVGNRLWQQDLFLGSTAAIGAGGRAYTVTRGATDGRIEGRDQDGARRFHYILPSHVVPIGPVALGRGVKDAGVDTTVVCRPSDSERDHRVINDPDADNVYFTASDGKLYAVDYKGRRRWTFGVRLTSPPVVLGLSDGPEIVLVGDQTPPPEEGYVHGLRGENGEQLWKFVLDSPVLGSLAVHQTRIYVATQRSLYAIGYPRAVVPDEPVKPPPKP
jgi:hypothetical protein